MMTTEQALERIAIALETANQLKQPQQLGLKSDVGRKFLYVGKDQNTCWYFHRDGQNIPVIETALVGTVAKLEITEKEFKGNIELKLQISIDADVRYCVQSGLDTVFSHGFLQAFSLLTVEQMREVITISVRPGDEKTVFCTLKLQGEKVKFESDKHIDLNRLAQDTIDRMLGAKELPKGIRSYLPIPMNGYRKTLFTVLDKQIDKLAWNTDRCRKFLADNYDGKSSRFQLTDDELSDFTGRLEIAISEL